MSEIIKKHSNKFKSIYISNNFCIPITDKSNGINAILALVLSKSCENYKNEQEIEKYLASMYGAEFNVDTQKIGDLLNIEFSINIIDNYELNKKEDIINKGINFLNEIIYNHGEFKKDIFDREKQFVLEKIKTRKDEKLKYAVIKMEELLCKNEPFGEFVYGKEEDIENFKLEDLIRSYDKLISEAVNIITITGNLNNLEGKEKNIKVLSNNKNFKYTEKYINLDDKFEEYKENMETSQSVITIGMKVENLKLEDFLTLTLYNTILGGTPSSKLFQNVREKRSLAYSISSRYYRFKGVFIIYAGINNNSYEEAKSVILEQINDMKNNITDQEIDAAKQDIISTLLEWEDSKVFLGKNEFIKKIEGRKETIDELISNINKISIKDIINISNRIKVKNIYFLSGESNE